MNYENWPTEKMRQHAMSVITDENHLRYAKFEKISRFTLMVILAHHYGKPPPTYTRKYKPTYQDRKNF